MDNSWDLTPSQVLTKELESGERLVWGGRPRQGIYFQRSDIAKTLFGLLSLGFFAAWWQLAVPSGGKLFMAFGVFFLGSTLHNLVGRFPWDAWVRSRTYYALTDRRALILRLGRRRSLNSVPLTSLDELSFREGPGMRGTIILGPETPSGEGSAYGGPAASPRFEQIKNGREVYNTILRLKPEAPPLPSDDEPMVRRMLPI